MAFRGSFDYSLDAKNRLTVPAKFRAELCGGVVLAKGLEPNVEIWGPDAYDAFVERSLQGLNPMSSDADAACASAPRTRSTPSSTPPAACSSRPRSSSTRGCARRSW